MKMVQLTDGDQHLIRKVLDYATACMSGARCNDTPPDWLDRFTDSELEEIHGFIEGGQRDPDGVNYSRHQRADDVLYVDYLEELLVKENGQDENR